MPQGQQFFFDPVYTPYKPIHTPLDMEAIIKIAQMGQEKVGNQLALLQKVSDKAGETDAYLSQDIDKVAGTTKEIDSEIERLVSDNVNLLDPKNTAGVMKIAKKYMHDPELLKIAGRTAKIKESLKTVDEMRKSGKLSAENYWEFSKSLTDADEAYKTTQSYNPNVALHYDVIPYTDVQQESLEAVKSARFYTQSSIVNAPNHYNYIETVTAMDPAMAARMRSALKAGQTEEYNALKAENERAIAEDFLSTLSPGAKIQLMAAARMHNENENTYVYNYAIGMAHKMSGSSVTISDYNADQLYINAKKQAFDREQQQRGFAHDEAMEREKAKNAAKAKAAEAKAAGDDSGLRATYTSPANMNVKPTNPYGLSAKPTFGEIATKVYDKEKSIGSFGSATAQQINKTIPPQYAGALSVVYDPNDKQLHINTTMAYAKNPAVLNYRDATLQPIVGTNNAAHAKNKSDVAGLNRMRATILQENGISEKDYVAAVQKGSALYDNAGIVRQTVYSKDSYIDAEIEKLKNGKTAVAALSKAQSITAHAPDAYTISASTPGKGLTDPNIRKVETAAALNTLSQAIDVATGKTITDATEAATIKTALSEGSIANDKGVEKPSGINTVQYVFNNQTAKWEMIISFNANTGVSKMYRFPASRELVKQANLTSVSDNQIGTYVASGLRDNGVTDIPGSSATIIATTENSQIVNTLNYFGYESNLSAKQLPAPYALAAGLSTFEAEYVPAIAQTTLSTSDKITRIAAVLVKDYGYSEDAAASIAGILLNK